MFIVDSQVHIWKEETPDRPWIPGARERMKLNGHRTEAFTYEECLELMDAAGVDRAMIVPPSLEGDRIDYALEACEAHPDRFGIMARIPQNKPAEARAMMRDWESIPGVKGTRLTFHRPQDRNWMIDGTADLYVHPNIYVKVSSLPSYSTHPYPYSNIAKYVINLVNKMGPERCFWGTDLTRLTETKGINYVQAIEHFTKHMGLSESQLEWIMGKGICECLGWPA